MSVLTRMILWQMAQSSGEAPINDMSINSGHCNDQFILETTSVNQ